MTVNEWRAAAKLVAHLTLGLGVLLVAIGATKSFHIYGESRRGQETIATIDAAQLRQLGVGGWVDLSWQDRSGATRQALGVEVTGDLGRKLRLGGALVRSQLRIRYTPEKLIPSVLVVEDIPERLKRAAALSIAGFFAISAASLIMLWLTTRRDPPPAEPPASP